MKRLLATLSVSLLLAGQALAAPPADPWKAATQAGTKSFSAKNYAAARKSWSDALSQSEHFAPTDPRLAQSLDNMASVAKAEGKYAEAEKYYSRALGFWKKNPKKNDLAMGLTVINLASAIASQGDYKRAKAFYSSEHKNAAPAASIKCYMCEESKSVVPIFYGRPGPQMKKLIKQGRVKLGGPVPKQLPENRWFCTSCDAPL